MDNLSDRYACSHSGSCALAGAAAFFAGIEDAHIIINGQLWCYFYAQRRVERQCPAAGERMLCTYIDGTAIIYGTENELIECLSQVKSIAGPAVVAVINSCAVSLIGDDTAGIAAQAGLNCPVVCVDSSGLYGGYTEGYQAAAKAYFNQMPLAGGLEVKPLTVNLLGCTLGYYHGQADLAEVVRLLNLGGCTVNAVPGGGSTVREIGLMRQAELNIVLHRELGEDLARTLYDRYHIPFLTLLPPYGIEGTVKWGEAVFESLSAKPSSRCCLAQEAGSLARELHQILLNVQRLWGNLWFDRIVAAGPPSVAMAIGQAVRFELADTRRLAVILHEHSFRPQPVSGIDAVIAYTADSMVQAELVCLQGGLLLGSSSETARLRQLGVKMLAKQNIALPVLDEVVIRPRPFAGLEGMRYLTECLWNGFIQLQGQMD